MEEEKDSDVGIGYVQESFDICRIWLSSILNHKQNSNFLIMCTVPFIFILALQSELPVIVFGKRLHSLRFTFYLNKL